MRPGFGKYRNLVTTIDIRGRRTLIGVRIDNHVTM